MKVMLSAGEASGDELGAGLARALRARRPEVELVGMGGPRMEAAGVRILQDAASVAVVGLFEVLTHLGDIRAAMRRLERALVEEKPDLLVPVDFPDFNLRLAERARRAGVPVVYFVSPQVWAWRRGRVHTIRERVERMLVLFPFEVEFYEQAGVPVTFVGHPMVDRVAEDLPRAIGLERAGLDGARRWVGLLPGSRTSEATRLLPVFLEAARRLAELHPDLGFVLPRASTLPTDVIREILRRTEAPAVEIVDDAWPDVLGALDAAWVASGTASLETALARVPASIAYRVHPFTWLLAERLVEVDHVGLPNLVVGERLVPERIQSECRPERLAADLDRWLADPAARDAQREALRRVRTALGRGGAYEAAAAALERHLPGSAD